MKCGSTLTLYNELKDISNKLEIGNRIEQMKKLETFI
jgi:hypothetical protein